MQFQPVNVSHIFLVCIMVCVSFVFDTHAFIQRPRLHNGIITYPISAKSRMPVFDEDDEAELASIMNDVFSNNVPKKKVGNEPTASKVDENTIKKNQPTVNAVSILPTVIPKKAPSLVSPNSDWRTATNDRYASKSGSRKPVQAEEDDYFSFTDLDYDDFEEAMREIEMGGMSVRGDKISEIPQEHEGLSSGDTLGDSFWERLLDSEGAKINFSRVHQERADVLVIYADPRRMSESFKTVVNEFKKIPQAPLNIALAAINCDDANDHRKFLKKVTLPFKLMTDPTKQVMELMKCRANKRLKSALLLLDVRTSRVLKIWYEDSWDELSTRDLVVEEMKEYRKNPSRFMQSQIGLR